MKLPRLRMPSLRFTPLADPALFWTAIFLSVVGLFFVFDAGYARSIAKENTWLPKEFVTQAGFLAVCIPIALWVGGVRAETVERRHWAVLAVCLALVLSVKVIGVTQNGATRWIGYGIVRIQPSEFMKVGTVIFLAGVFATRKPLPKLQQFDPGKWMDNVFPKWLPRIAPFFLLVLAIVSIEREPDLGTGAVIGAIMLAMFIVGGVSGRSLAAIAVLCAAGGVFLSQNQGYRLERIINHEQRWAEENVDDVSYQTVQAELAMASGGWTGVGIGNGKAKHVLPATTTDFVMATVAEEFGLIGAIFVLGALGFFVGRLVLLAFRAPTQFGRLYLMGFASWIGVQTTVNMTMANAALPAIGIPLPFISSGGSSLAALWLAVGMTQSVLRVTEPKSVPATSPVKPVLEPELRWHMR